MSSFPSNVPEPFAINLFLSGLTHSGDPKGFSRRFVTRRDTLLLEAEMDSSGTAPTRPHSSLSQASLIDTPAGSTGLREEEEDRSRGYGTFATSSHSLGGMSVQSAASQSTVSPGEFYLRLRFGDKELCRHRDAAFAVVHTRQYATQAPSELRRGIVSLGMRLKKTKDRVVGGTAFLVNQTGRVGSSLMTYMNGEVAEESKKEVVVKKAKKVEIPPTVHHVEEEAPRYFVIGNMDEE